MANKIDPNQTPHSVASDEVLHYLHKPVSQFRVITVVCGVLWVASCLKLSCVCKGSYVSEICQPSNIVSDLCTAGSELPHTTIASYND